MNGEHNWQHIACPAAALTNLWLHVNTFFIKQLIFFWYGSHIKKYMARCFRGIPAKNFYRVHDKFS